MPATPWLPLLGLAALIGRADPVSAAPEGPMPPAPPRSTAPKAPRPPASPPSATPDGPDTSRPKLGPPFQGGFVLPEGGWAFDVSLGWPHSELGARFGAAPWLELGVGWRTLLGLTHAPMLRAALRLGRGAGRRAFGASLRAAAGFQWLPHGVNRDLVASLALGEGVVGELGAQVGHARGRHRIFLAAGVRASEFPDLPGCRNPLVRARLCGEAPFHGAAGVLFTATVELGWAVRLTPRLSLAVGAGVDVMLNGSLDRVAPRGQLALEVSMDDERRP